MKDTPCCNFECNQGRDCIRRLEAQHQTRVLAVALVTVIVLLTLTVCL